MTKMDAPIEDDFVSNFVSLTGTTVGERRKNLFLLLRKTRQSAVASNIDFSALQPRTPLEEIFKVQALIYFRKVLDLLQILKGGNSILIQKILNASPWFIEAAFQHMDGEELVENYFPYFSYNTKLKLLHKMSLHLKDSKKAEEFFEAVEEKYGLYLASKLFSACSKLFVLKLIAEKKIEVTPGQLLRVVKKQPHLAQDILENLNQRPSNVKLSIRYENVFKHLLQNNPKLFDDIQEKYIPEVYLGIRATRSFICMHRDLVMQDPNKFYYYFLRKKLGKSLKRDFEVFYTNIFPKSLRYFIDNLEEYIGLLRHIPSDSKKLELLLRVFKKQFGKELWEYCTIIKPKLIEMMSPDDREIWMQTHSRPENICEAQWISLMKTDKALLLLKQNIACTSVIKERGTLIRCLVRTCLINHDKSALLDVCKYVASKHRNDNIIVREEFMNALYYSKYLIKLDAEHWQSVIDLVRLAKLNGEEDWLCKNMFKKYIHFCLDNQLPIRDLLVEYTKFKYVEYNMSCKNKNHEKTCLLMFADIIQNYSDNVSEEHMNYMHINLLYSLVKWNLKCPKDSLSLFNYGKSIEYLKRNLENKETAYTELNIVLRCVTYDHEKTEEANLVELFFKHRNKTWYYSRRMMNLLLKYHPLLFRKHIGVITDNVKHFITGSNSLNSNLYRYYSHLGITQKISELLRQQIKSDDKRKVAVVVLSSLMNPEAFLNETAKYIPKKLTIDLSTPEKRDEHKYQKAFMPCLKNVIPSSRALPSVLEFCKGDYLNMVQPSLHSLCLSVPENELMPFYSTLLNRAVSVKKSAICLAFNTVNRASVKRFSAQLVSEEHASIRKALFKATFKYFARNPNDYSWEMTKSCMKVVDCNDKEAVEILTSRGWFSSFYFRQYVSFAWQVCEEREKTATGGRENILDAFNSLNIVSVPTEFFENVFERYLFKSKKLTNFDMKVHCFACKYMIYYILQVDVTKRMKLIFDIFKAYVRLHWNNVTTSLICRQSSVNFVKAFCGDFLNKKCDNKHILLEFINQWNAVLEPHQALFEYLYLQFTLIYLCKLQDELSMSQLSQRLVHLYNNVVDDKLAVTNVFCECFNEFKQLFELEKDKHQDEEFYNLLDGILSADSSENILMLVVSLLPTENVVAPDVKCKYDRIIETLLNHKSRSVQVHLNSYLNKLSIQLEEKREIYSWDF